MVTIAVIGAGKVGGALGEAFSKRGNTIRYGVRDQGSPRSRELAGAHPDASVHTVPEAVAPAEVVILATPWNATEAAITSAGDLAGKIILDCTNPLVMRSGSLELAFGRDDSGGEAVARWAKRASVFKTLNQAGFEIMSNAAAFQPKPVMFVAGDDAGRKPPVLDLVASIGFEAVDFGKLEGARLLEAFALVWIKLAYGDFGRDFAFALARTKKES
jgi:predicted dinucleotide-binding enzyme